MIGKILPLLTFFQINDSFLFLCLYVDALPGENVEGSVMFSIRLYVAENDETLNLVEGERVIILGKDRLILLLNSSIIESEKSQF